jgi:RNA polymerase sigma-54 factor
MKQSLNIKLSQGLKLTPQLQQSIRLLQLSVVELNTEIQEMLDTNPLLEEDAQKIEKSKNDIEDHAKNAAETTSSENDWQQSFETRQTHSKSNLSEAPDVYATAENNQSLKESLIWQTQMTSLSNKDKLIAEVIIHSLNEKGYLPLSDTELSQLFPIDLEIEEDEIAAVLKLIQTLEPTGIAARDLEERLRIIFKSIEIQNPKIIENKAHQCAKEILGNHFELLSQRNMAKLKTTLSISQEDLIHGIQYIQKINPHIENQHEKDENLYIIPDILVKKVNNGWNVQLNPNINKNVRLNDTYISIPKEKLNGDASKYISESLQEAKWFIKSLNNRYDTLKRVANAIVSNQTEFFQHGETALKPMVLQKIAEELELHESTISRATSNKYMQTPLGVFELKYFFSTSLGSEDGEGVSATAIRSFIKTIIDNEEKQKPISDSKIAKMLDDKGFTVARRTVAKYREGMNIPSSSKRKSLV